jgi:hypothetical protein
MLKLKSQIVSVVVGVFVASALLGAQAAQSPTKIKNVRKQITLSQDVKVGSTVLKTGEYQVTSNDQELTFRRLMEDPAYGGQWIPTRDKPVVVKCTVTTLVATSRGTQLDMPADPSGVAVLKSITLDGTSVKFTIEQ